MKKLNYKYFMVLDEVLAVFTIAWLIFMAAELIKPGLVSNYYDLNLHFIIIIVLLVFRLVHPGDN